MLLLQDACVLLNLLGSGGFEDIVREVGRPVAVSASAAREALYLRNAETGEREPIDLAFTYVTQQPRKLTLQIAPCAWRLRKRWFAPSQVC